MLSDQVVGQEQVMRAVNVAEGKARFSELVARAEAGEEVVVSRRGRPVVRIVAVDRADRPLDIDALRRHQETLAASGVPLVDGNEFWRLFRAGDRY